MDKLLVHRMYHCSDRALRKCSLKSDPCLNNGYVGDSCACVCPSGTEGTFCEVVHRRYDGECMLLHVVTPRSFIISVFVIFVQEKYFILKDLIGLV